MLAKCTACVKRLLALCVLCVCLHVQSSFGTSFSPQLLKLFTKADSAQIPSQSHSQNRMQNRLMHDETTKQIDKIKGNKLYKILLVETTVIDYKMTCF